MVAVRMTQGKFDGINKVANAAGVIAAAAMDQRGSLKKMIAHARGEGAPDVTDADLTAFKTAVTRVLTPHATGILMDPEYGLPALAAKDPHAGVLLAYEKTGYDAHDTHRLPDLLDGWSVRRLIAAGADVIKLLLYYNADDDAHANEIKHAFVERLGAECMANDVPFFMEVVTFNDAAGDEHGFAYAQEKPAQVRRAMAEFTQPQYGVDVLKVEVPVNMAYVAGTQAFTGPDAAYMREDAMRLMHEAAAVATIPFIYLSAGVSAPVFRETLALVAEAQVPYTGVLCGRATWEEGVPAYAKGGADGLTQWLESEGVANITALNEVLARGAKPWWTVYGGKDQIEVVPRAVATTTATRD